MVDGFIDVGGEFFTLVGDEVFDGSMAVVQIVEKSEGNFHGGLYEEVDRVTLERNGAGTMVRSFPEGAAAAVVVIGFDVGADASPPVSGSHTGAHALGADVGHTFMEEAEGGWLKNGWDDG